MLVLKKRFHIWVAIIWLAACCISAPAQQAQPEQPQTPEAKVAPPATAVAPDTRILDDDRYRIGPGDVLDIRVFNRPQLSREAVRVDGRGAIRMPLIDEEIMAACKTENEVASEIATRYLKYQRNPQVDVFIKEYQSQPVAIIGAVSSPGRFQLQRRVRLLELLTFAGGPDVRAGRTVNVVRTEPGLVCETASEVVGETSESGLVSYNLSETLRGEARANPYMRPGDIISLPDAEQAFIVGNVLNPKTIVLNEPVTVSRAIAMAGGVMPDTKSNRVRVIRQSPGGAGKTEIIVDLKAIEKRRAEDVALQAGDIVDVPTSGGKRFLRTIVSTIAPTIGQLPVRVVR